MKCVRTDSESKCKIGGEWDKPIGDLKKEQCSNASAKSDNRSVEWVPGHTAVLNSAGASKGRIRSAVQRGGENWKQTREMQELETSTRENIEWEHRPGYCRIGRNRAQTQPETYETSTDEQDEDLSLEEMAFQFRES